MSIPPISLSIWLAYRYLPMRRWLFEVVQPLVGEPDEELLRYFDLLIRHVKLDVRSQGPFSREELLRFKAPTLLVVARSDVLSLMNRVIARAREIVAKLVAVEAVDGSHVPTRGIQHHVSKRIRHFLKESSCAYSSTSVTTRRCHDL
jgi:hypothetical protein